MAKRFRIAFSFAGEKRDYVEQMATILASKFGEDNILYDKFHEAEFATPRLGLELPDLYRNEADLIVMVVCPNYSHKTWCGLEWTGIHGIMMSGRHKDIMLCRFEHAPLQGLFENAGYVELDHKTPDQAVTLILQRLALNEGKPKDAYAGAVVASMSTAAVPAGVAVAPTASTPPGRLSPAERLTLMSDLTSMLPQQFGTLLFTLSPPSGIIPHTTAPLADRAEALLNWAESKSGPGLDVVRDYYRQIVGVR